MNLKINGIGKNQKNIKMIRPITRGLGAFIGGTILYDRVSRGYSLGKRQGEYKYIGIITEQQNRQLTSNHDSNLWNGLQKWWFRSTLDNQTVPNVLKTVYGIRYAITNLFDLDTLIPIGLALLTTFSKSKLGLASLGLLAFLGFEKSLRVTGVKKE